MQILGDKEQQNNIGLCTPNTAKIRMVCANIIWREWSNERHWGPRVGAIIIQDMEKGAEKVSFIYGISGIERKLIFS